MMIGLEVRKKVKEILTEKCVIIKASVEVPEIRGNYTSNEVEEITERDLVRNSLSEATKFINVVTIKDYHTNKVTKNVDFCIVPVEDIRYLISFVNDIFKNDGE